MFCVLRMLYENLKSNKGKVQTFQSSPQQRIDHPGSGSANSTVVSNVMIKFSKKEGMIKPEIGIYIIFETINGLS